MQPGGRYSIADAIRDGGTIPVHFEPRVGDWQVWGEKLPVNSFSRHSDPPQACRQNGEEIRRGRGQSRRDSEGQSQPSLDIRVSQGVLEQALSLMNALAILLEAEGFPVTIDTERNWTVAEIFGYRIRFAITEKLERTGQHVEHDRWGSTVTVADRLLTGVLELRLGDFSYGQQLRDNRRDGKLEGRLAECLGKLMRLGREEVLRAEHFKRQKEESNRAAEERRKRGQAIKEEEERVEVLEVWTAAWSHAKNMRAFIDAYEARLVSLGAEVTPGTPDGDCLTWMRQQADRLDPLTDSPSSVLDRIGELRGWRPFDV